MADERHRKSVAFLTFFRFTDPFHGKSRIGFLSADTAAEVAVALYGFQIGAVVINAAKLGHGLAAGDHKGDELAVRDGVDSALHTVSCSNAAHAYHHLVSLCTGHGKLCADGAYQFHDNRRLHDDALVSEVVLL